MAVEIRFKNQKEILRKFDPTKLLGPPTRELMEDVGEAMRDAAQKIARKPRGATGDIAGSIDFRVGPGIIPTSLKIFSPKIEARWANAGRKPGKAPPPAELLQLSGGDMGVAVQISRAIAKKGTRKLRFMQKGANAVRRAKLPALIALAERNIKTKYKKIK